MPNFRDVLIMQKKELDLFSRKTYIHRNIKLNELDKDIIKVIIGPRRAGKSFFAIHELKIAGNFGYVNFDDESLVHVENYNDIVETVNSLYNNPRILFLDEIQNLPRWELFVNRLQRQGFNIILTGSNSNLLSSELATHLTGRYTGTIVFPFSFKEYLSYFDEGRELTTSEMKEKLHGYIHHGGFPEPLVKGLDYNGYLKTLHDSILYKDIVKRHNIRSIKPMENLSRYLISNSGSFIGFRNLAKLAGLKSINTVMKYLRHLEESFLYFQLNAFSFKYKEQVRSSKKVYSLDNGMIGANAFIFIPGIGVLYENLVAIELKRRELNGELEFYYYKNARGYEIDFVVKQGLEVTQLIQVCYNLDNEKTKTRELRSLIHGVKDLHCHNLVVLTGDYENTEVIEWYGIKGTVRFIPLWKWLSGSDL